MPLPRKKDTEGEAPVMDLLRAHIRLSGVEEYVEPYVVTRKSDGVEFTYDPGFNCEVTIVDDGEDGELNGTKFYEKFRYKQDKDGRWCNKENSKLRMLTKVVEPKYFEDHSVPDLTEEDLEGFEMVCQIKPKKNPNSGVVTGSTIDWETMKPLKKKPTADAVEVDGLDEDGFADIPI